MENILANGVYTERDFTRVANGLTAEEVMHAFSYPHPEVFYFGCSMVFSDAVWQDSVAWTIEDTKRQIRQEMRERFAEVISGVYAVLAGHDGTEDEWYCGIFRVPRDGRSVSLAATTLKVTLTHGVDGSQTVIVKRLSEA